MFEANYKLLKTIIDDNKNTEYGKKYNFSEIKTIDEYRNKVPLTNYDDYVEYIKRMYDGEKNILTSYPIICYLYTSGSLSYCQKKIPCSIKALQNLGNKPFILRNKLIRKNKNNKFYNILHIGNYHIDIKKEVQKTLLLSEICYYYVYKEKIEDFNNYFGGSDLIFDIHTFDYLYEKIWISILVENIQIIDSPYMFSILQFFIEFEKSYKDIISDIRKRKINPEKKLSEKAEKYLLDLPVSEERLLYVETECQKGFEGIASRLWKDLQLIIGIRSKAFIYENENLDKYIKNIPKSGYLYAMCESFIGFASEINSYNYLIDPTFSFYEFLPYNENNENMGNGKTLLINEVESGKYYELVITTLSGFYRYKTGDIIKIIKNNEKELSLEYSFRKNLSINIKAEKTTIIHIEITMKKINEIIPNISGFLMGATIYNNTATYFLILFLENKSLKVSLKELEKKLDYFLGEANIIYKHYRELNILGPSKIIIKNKEEFNEIQNKIKHKKSHNKQKYIISEEALIKILKKEGYINSE